MLCLSHQEAASRTPDLHTNVRRRAGKCCETTSAKIQSISCCSINLERRQLPLQVSRRIVGSLASSCMSPSRYGRPVPKNHSNLQQHLVFLSRPLRGAYRSPIHAGPLPASHSSSTVEHVDWCNPARRRLFLWSSLHQRMQAQIDAAVWLCPSLQYPPSTPSVLETVLFLLCTCPIFLLEPRLFFLFLFSYEPTLTYVQINRTRSPYSRFSFYPHSS